MNSELPNIPSTQMDEMDEFESTAKGTSQLKIKSGIKLVKFAVIGLAVVFLVGAGIYALSLLSQTQKGNNQQQPGPSVVAQSTPIPTPEINLPDEYKIIEKKVSDYDKSINNPQEGRVRLNVPAMNITVGF